MGPRQGAVRARRIRDSDRHRCTSPTRTRRGSGQRTRTPMVFWQYFPKGTDLSRWSADDLEAVALAINNRPRKVLDWKTPAEVFCEQLASVQDPGVASTD